MAMAGLAPLPARRHLEARADPTAAAGRGAAARRHRRRRAAAAAAAGQPATPTEYDPEGLFQSAPAPAGGGGLIERRERERAAARAAAAGGAPPPPRTPADAAPPIRPLPPAALAAHPGGVPAADGAAYDRAELEARLGGAVDLDFPGLRVLHLDPAVFVADGFLPADECAAMVAAAEATGALAPSRVGAGNAAGAAGAGGAAAAAALAYSSRRTSSSLLLDGAACAAAPGLAAAVARLQARAHALLGARGGAGWGPPGRPPAPGQLCFESPQVARYDAGQHFLEHEDAFPPAAAAANGFQRRATVLTYLNDVPRGGATSFGALGLAVRPAAGRALLFFPSAPGGAAPDARTVHAAEDAVDVKWATQQWVAVGVGAGGGGAVAGASAGAAAPRGGDDDGGDVAAERVRRAKKGGARPGKGRGGAPAKGFGKP